MSVPVTLGVAACGDAGTTSSRPNGDASSASDAEMEAGADADAGFCSDDRPPEMRNYPGCAPPFCVLLDGADSSADAGAELDAQSDVELDAVADGDLDAGSDGDLDAGSDVVADAPITCQTLCGPTARPVVACSYFAFAGKNYVKCQTDCTGRRPAGFVRDRARALDEPGAYFAEMARLEAASIHAFRLLAKELAAHGAPATLRRAARRAARDEIAHTRAMRSLAARFGGRVELPRFAAAPARPLEAVAIENAAEGCVRETFGALVAGYQARAARDPSVRRAMARVARDELRHAALAWRVARWSERRLSPASRALVAAALDGAERELRHDLVGETVPALAAVAGLPPGHELRRMAEALGRELWEQARG